MRQSFDGSIERRYTQYRVTAGTNYNVTDNLIPCVEERVFCASEMQDLRRRPPFPVFFRAGNCIRKYDWTESSLDRLPTLFLTTFGLTEKQSESLFAQDMGETDENFKTTSPIGRYSEQVSLECVPNLLEGSVIEVTQPLWKSLCICASFHDGLPDELEKKFEELNLATSAAIPDLGKLSTQERWHQFLNEPTSSSGAMVLAIWIMLLIFVSTVSYCVETLPQIYDPDESLSVWMLMEAFCILSFTVELLLRFIVEIDRYAFCMDVMNVVDLVSIVPFYLELMFASIEVPGLSLLRVMRLARVFRLLKVSRESISVLTKTMTRSAKPLFILVFLTSIAMVVFAAIIYYCERGEYDETLQVWMRKYGYRCSYECEAIDANCPAVGAIASQDTEFRSGKKDTCVALYEQTPFESIPASCWWALVTMTTVGYGDMYPITPQGRFVGAMTMMFGILVIALPVTVIGSNFTAIYEKLATSIVDVEAEADDYKSGTMDAYGQIAKIQEQSMLMMTRLIATRQFKEDPFVKFRGDGTEDIGSLASPTASHRPLDR